MKKIPLKRVVPNIVTTKLLRTRMPSSAAHRGRVSVAPAV